MNRKSKSRRARWIVVAACTLLAIPLSAAHARNGTTNLTLHLEAGIIVEPPRLLNGAAALESTHPLVDSDVDCDGLEARGGLSTGRWRILTLHPDGSVQARIVAAPAGDVITPVTPTQLHCDSVLDWAGGAIRTGRTLLSDMPERIRPSAAAGGSLTFVVEQP